MSAACAAVTPGLAGTPAVARPEPRLGEQAVDVAVVGAGELDDRVAAGGGAGQAQRLIVASVPELTIRTISTHAKRSTTSAASSTSPAVGAP